MIVITKQELLHFAKTEEGNRDLLWMLDDRFVYEVVHWHLDRRPIKSYIYLKLNPGDIELSLSEFYFKLEPLAEWLTLIKGGLNLSGLSSYSTTQTQTSAYITSILYNEAKRITTVVFSDGDVRMATHSKDDAYDPNVGVAICIAAHQFKSKSKFKKFVAEHLKTKEKTKK